MDCSARGVKAMEGHTVAYHYRTRLVSWLRWVSDAPEHTRCAGHGGRPRCYGTTAFYSGILSGAEALQT